MKTCPPEYVGPSRFRIYRLTDEKLKAAITAGLLREGDHYIWFNGARRYHWDKIRALIPEISNLKSRIRWKRSKKRHPMTTNTELKRKLAKQINDLVVRQKELEDELEQLLVSRRILDTRFNETYWETAHCPYCQGTKDLNGERCFFCR